METWQCSMSACGGCGLISLLFGLEFWFLSIIAMFMALSFVDLASLTPCSWIPSFLPAAAQMPLTIFTSILEVLPGLEHILHLCHLWFSPLSLLLGMPIPSFKIVKCWCMTASAAQRLLVGRCFIWTPLWSCSGLMQQGHKAAVLCPYAQPRVTWFSLILDDFFPCQTEQN